MTKRLLQRHMNFHLDIWREYGAVIAAGFLLQSLETDKTQNHENIWF